MATDVRHVPEHNRYELLVDGQLSGVVEYTGQGDRLVFRHTEVSIGRRGQGLGAVLVRAALEDVRRNGRTVVPHCWYVAEFIELNPEFADLLAA